MKKFIQKLKDKILISLPLKFKKKILLNMGKGSKKALVYFKTDPFFSNELRKAYIHTNNEEIVLMVQVLNEKGYSVDLIDREASWEEIAKLSKNSYDLYIGNAAGNSADYHVDILKNFNIKKKILFAAGPEAYTSNDLVNKQHLNFKKRKGANPVVRRLVKGDHFEERYLPLDAIITIGETFNAKSYEKWGKKIYPLLPSSSPSIKFDSSLVKRKNPLKFIYFGGNGNICKGLDVVLDAFDGLKDVQLDVCAPDEKDFWDAYNDVLKKNPQIRYHGFVPVGGDLFHKLTEEAAWTVFPASAEGCATSVVTCMRRGIVPVVTYEAGINLGNFGHELEFAEPAILRKKVIELTETPKSELQKRSAETLRESERYTIEYFIVQFSSIVEELSK